MDSEALTFRSLSVSDAQTGFDLSSKAGWNQTLADWERLLEQGQGFGCFSSEDQCVGTAIVCALDPDRAWVSMVLVEPNWRRKGLGTRLVRSCMTWARRWGRIPALDATPAGAPLYAQLGFIAHSELSRLSFVPHEPAVEAGAQVPDQGNLRLIHETDLGAIIEWDRERTGFGREALLSWLRQMSPAWAYQCDSDRGERLGYILGRPGSKALQLGPLVALDDHTAVALVQRLQQAYTGPIMIDVPDIHTSFVDRLCTLGFVRQRPLTRMVLDGETIPGSENVYATAGPEWC